MSYTLRLGIPSNERLLRKTLDLLNSAEIPIKHRPRFYQGHGERWGRLEVFFLRSSDIVRFVDAGSIDIGVSTEEIIDEAQSNVRIICPLDFSRSRIVVASQKIKKLEDLSGKIVATSYPNITNRFFTDKGIKDVRVLPAQGTVEAFPLLNLADAIVDLTETGDTLRANNLEIIDEIRKQQAVLIARPVLSEMQEMDLKFIQKSLEGTIKARNHRRVRCLLPATNESVQGFYKVIEKYSSAVEGLRTVETNRYEFVCHVDTVSRLMRVMCDHVPDVQIELYPIALLFR